VWPLAAPKFQVPNIALLRFTMASCEDENGFARHIGMPFAGTDSGPSQGEACSRPRQAGEPVMGTGRAGPARNLTAALSLNTPDRGGGDPKSLNVAGVLHGKAGHRGRGAAKFVRRSERIGERVLNPALCLVTQ
jgi:hypothetical protein